VSVKTQAVGLRVTARVHNKGAGILADTKVEIFQSFLTTKPTGEGTDLSLSLAYDIIAYGTAAHAPSSARRGVGT
jgi:two-component system NtrC family sensor kinase